jgi:GT2 family glycosyltransferase
MTAPGIAVVIVTCDRPRLLADALKGVAAQTVAPREVRIGDDGTLPAEIPDDLGLLEVTVVPCGERRSAIARNRTVAGSRAEVLAFLDDDDRWRPDHLAGFGTAFADPAVEFAWRDCVVVREEIGADGARRDREALEIARDWDDAMMRDNDYLPPSTWAFRRSLFEKLGGFDESFAFSEDWDLVLRAAAVTRPRRVPGVTVEVRMREQGNASADFGPERLDCLRRLAARHGLPPLEPRTFWEVARHVAAAR